MTTSTSEAFAAAATLSVISAIRAAPVWATPSSSMVRGVAYRRDGLGKRRQLAQRHRVPRQRQVGRHRKAGIAGAQHRYVRSHSPLPARAQCRVKATARLRMHSRHTPQQFDQHDLGYRIVGQMRVGWVGRDVDQGVEQEPGLAERGYPLLEGPVVEGDFDLGAVGAEGLGERPEAK